MVNGISKHIEKIKCRIAAGLHHPLAFVAVTAIHLFHWNHFIPEL
jgi:hypothetical protein